MNALPELPKVLDIEMAPLARLAPMTSESFEIVIEARLPGQTRLHIEVSADQLERGAVIEEESTGATPFYVGRRHDRFLPICGVSGCAKQLLRDKCVGHRALCAAIR